MCKIFILNDLNQPNIVLDLIKIFYKYKKSSHVDFIYGKKKTIINIKNFNLWEPLIIKLYNFKKILFLLNLITKFKY